MVNNISKYGKKINQKQLTSISQIFNMTCFDIVLGKPYILKVLDKEILLNVYRKGTTSTIFLGGSLFSVAMVHHIQGP